LDELAETIAGLESARLDRQRIELEAEAQRRIDLAHAERAAQEQREQAEKAAAEALSVYQSFVREHVFQLACENALEQQRQADLAWAMAHGRLAVADELAAAVQRTEDECQRVGGQTPTVDAVGQAMDLREYLVDLHVEAAAQFTRSAFRGIVSIGKPDWLKRLRRFRRVLHNDPDVSPELIGAIAGTNDPQSGTPLGLENPFV